MCACVHDWCRWALALSCTSAPSICERHPQPLTCRQAELPLNALTLLTIHTSPQIILHLDTREPHACCLACNTPCSQRAGNWLCTSSTKRSCPCRVTQTLNKSRCCPEPGHLLNLHAAACNAHAGSMLSSIPDSERGRWLKQNQNRNRLPCDAWHSLLTPSLTD